MSDFGIGDVAETFEKIAEMRVWAKDVVKTLEIVDNLMSDVVSVVERKVPDYRVQDEIKDILTRIELKLDEI